MGAIAGVTVPSPRANDNDDVNWALSTAVALWTAGSWTGALSWVRRAAEAATDHDDEPRALELLMAAASIASSLPPPKSGRLPPALPTSVTALAPLPSMGPLPPPSSVS